MAVRILWLIAMVLFTPLAGAVLNYDVFTWRSVAIVLAWTVTLLAPYVATGRRWLYVTAATLLFAEGFINLFHWALLRCPLNASSMFVFMNTNWDEATEFMTVKMTPALLLLVPYTGLYVMTLMRTPALGLRRRCEVMVWGALWLTAGVFFAENAVNGRFVRLAMPDVGRAVVSFARESREFRNLRTRGLMEVEAQMRTEDSTLVVVIIGESTARGHMSLYGYGRETTPRLSARDDIAVYDDVVSANSNTLGSVMNFLTENNMEHALPMDSCVHVFDVLGATPYRTWWLSNQSPVGLWDNGVTSLAQNADVTTYVNLTANSSMESTKMASYDERLMVPLQAALEDGAKYRMVFVHLMGCHTDYAKRYPRGFERYETSGDKRSRTVNAYDNAVLYNDYVVDSMLRMLEAYGMEHRGVRLTALYFSDHGENVYDEGEYAGHDWSGSIPRVNVEIPFIVWRPQWEEMQRGHVATPYMIDDLYHTLLDLAGVATPGFDSSRSVVNAHYNAGRERRLEDGNVYER